MQRIEQKWARRLMNWVRSTAHLMLVMLVVTGLVVGGLPVKAVEYTITDLGTLGGPYSYATAINDNGQIVGDSINTVGANHGFLYSNGSITDLGTLGGEVSVASDINNLGLIVGFSSTAGNELSRQGFLYSNGSMSRNDRLDLTLLQ
jgi:probable HAF family extracellular repeat protein